LLTSVSNRAVALFRMKAIVVTLVLLTAVATAVSTKESWEEERDGVRYRIWEKSHEDLPIGVYSKETLEMARTIQCTDTQTGSKVGLYDVVEHLEPTPDTPQTRESMLSVAITAICSPDIEFRTRDRRHTVDESDYVDSEFCEESRFEHRLYLLGVAQWNDYITELVSEWSLMCPSPPRTGDVDLVHLKKTCEWWWHISRVRRGNMPTIRHRLPHPIIPATLLHALTPAAPPPNGECLVGTADLLREACKRYSSIPNYKLFLDDLFEQAVPVVPGTSSATRLNSSSSLPE